MAMVPRVVRDGDYLAKIAHACGCSESDIWDHPKNADLKKLRKDPHMLCAGDQLYVPEPQTKWQSLAMGGNNAFTAPLPTVDVSMKLVGKKGPLAGVTCKLQGIDGMPTATTDGNGVLKLKVPVKVQTIVIDVDKPRFHAVAQVGHMDPPDTPSGVRMRLRNLHYLHDDQVPDAYFQQAVSKFQNDSGLPMTGVVDEATSKALVDAHGC
jgi:N-acetylmuramoyl-L-alanine amidase